MHQYHINKSGTSFWDGESNSMKEDLKHVGSFTDGQGKWYELYISKCDKLLHILNNLEQEEELHVVVRVEDTTGVETTLISGCDETSWERLKKPLVKVLSTHAPDIINCQTGFKFKILWEMWTG